MALGRLGSREFDLLSDADVVFVADQSINPEVARRAAERTVEFLTAYTRDGTVFPVDARLRPQGREGELVTTPSQLAKYFARDARPWEAISYLRLRFVAGDSAVGELALKSVREGIAGMAERPDFDRGLADMRSRLELSDTAPNSKAWPGGEYDIDFLAGRLQAQHRIWCQGNLSERVSLLLEDRCARGAGMSGTCRKCGVPADTRALRATGYRTSRQMASHGGPRPSVPCEAHGEVAGTPGRPHFGGTFGSSFAPDARDLPETQVLIEALPWRVIT